MRLSPPGRDGFEFDQSRFYGFDVDSDVDYQWPCVHKQETRYAQYLLGKVFKFLAVDPSIEITEYYIDILARNEQYLYKPSQEIVVRILADIKCTQHLLSSLMRFCSMLNHKELFSTLIDISAYMHLTEDGVTLNARATIKRQRKKGCSAVERTK